MNEDIGFLLTHIDNNAWYDNIIKQISLLIENNPYRHVCIFNSHSDKIETYNVPLLHINQAKYFEGNIFVFDIVALCIIKNFPLIKNKYFFSNDIPWYRSYNNYQEWKHIFQQDNLNIIAQNQEIYDLYEICWQQPIATMENFDYEKLSKIL